MKALVTGANGFVGSHLVDHLLEQGHEVACFVRQSSIVRWLEDKPVEIVYGDVADAETLPSALEGVDTVFHVAGVISQVGARPYERVNSQGTRNVLEAASQVSPSPPRVVYVSSLAAAGPSVTGTPRREEDPRAPISVYGRSKAAGEEHAHAFAHQVPVTVVRPPIVYGPRDRGVRELFRLASRGIFPKSGFAPKKYSVVHVHDLVRGILAAGEKGKVLQPGGGTEGIYFVADDGPYLWDDLGHAAGKALGKRVRIISLPDWAFLGIGLFGEMVGRIRKKPWKLSLDKAREGVASHWFCTAERARRELGFQVQYSLEEGFLQTARWYQSQGWI